MTDDAFLQIGALLRWPKIRTQARAEVEGRLVSIETWVEGEGAWRAALKAGTPHHIATLKAAANKIAGTEQDVGLVLDEGQLRFLQAMPAFVIVPPTPAP